MLPKNVHSRPVPELGEVEFFRRQWNGGLGRTIRSIHLHPHVRVFRDADVQALSESLCGAVLRYSCAAGKQIFFEASRRIYLAIHLGMTGRLRAAPESYKPTKHDHLLIRVAGCCLVFTDPRQFGRIRFHQGDEPPAWWTGQPPAVNSKEFTVKLLSRFLRRHRRLALKAALLRQDGFPGVGNWMADEILWRSRLDPRRLAGQLSDLEQKVLWQQCRFVCRQALRIVGRDHSDPPRGWLFHQRWKKSGVCPQHRRTSLCREQVGGRTTAWCPQCQR